MLWFPHRSCTHHRRHPPLWSNCNWLFWVCGNSRVISVQEWLSHSPPRGVWVHRRIGLAQRHVLGHLCEVIHKPKSLHLRFSSRWWRSVVSFLISFDPTSCCVLVIGRLGPLLVLFQYCLVRNKQRPCMPQLPFWVRLPFNRHFHRGNRRILHRGRLFWLLRRFIWLRTRWLFRRNLLRRRWLRGRLIVTRVHVLFDLILNLPLYLHRLQRYRGHLRVVGRLLFGPRPFLLNSRGARLWNRLDLMRRSPALWRLKFGVLGLFKPFTGVFVFHLLRDLEGVLIL